VTMPRPSRPFYFFVLASFMPCQLLLVLVLALLLPISLLAQGVLLALQPLPEDEVVEVEVGPLGVLHLLLRNTVVDGALGGVALVAAEALVFLLLLLHLRRIMTQLWSMRTTTETP
jgi:hypothetical protein